MPTNSYSALHEFLFHLRTPLSGIRGASELINKIEVVGGSIPSEAHEWLHKWLPQVNIWWREVVKLTELLGHAELEHHDWKDSIQQLISTLDGVEVAAQEAHDIPLTSTEEPGDLVRMMVHSIDHVYDRYKDMQDLLPRLI